MIAAESIRREERVLLLAPTARDAATTRQVLGAAGFACVPCPTVGVLCDEVTRGAGAVILTDHAWGLPDIGRFADVIQHQPAWSDLPIVALVNGGANAPLGREALRAFGNVTVLERPVTMASLASVVRTLLRSRQRQYQIREHLRMREQVAAELRESEARFRLMADSAPVLIWIAGLDGRRYWFNRPWLEFTGRSPDQERGDGWMAGVHPDDIEHVRQIYHRGFDRREAFQLDYRLRFRDGSYRWILGHGTPLHEAGGDFSGFIGSCIDITERRKVEQEREQLLLSEQSARALAEASAAEAQRAGQMKDEFLATLSHELRTPLNAILGWSQIVRRQPTDAQTLREGLATIERNARTQAQIIEDLLDMSRIVSGKVRLDIQWLDLQGIIRAATDSARPGAEAKGISIYMIPASRQGIISGDPNRLQQVFWNLLSNAVKFTPHGGEVRIATRWEGDHLAVSVADTGEGISADFLPHVFDRFRQQDASTTRRHGGLGLGLAIVKQLVEIHGGSVQVDSPGKGQGSTFTVRLPVAPFALQESQESEPPHLQSWRSSHDVRSNAVDLAGLRVLVVDDEPDARRLVCRLLEECHAVVVTAGSVDEALDVIDRERPELLLSDIGMPGRDGYSLIRTVRGMEAEDVRQIPAIALTAYARAEERAATIKAGYDAHATKPLEPSELLSLVARLGRKSVDTAGDHF